MRRNRAKKLQNFRNFGAPRAQNLHAFGQHTFFKPQNPRCISSLSRQCVKMQKSPSKMSRSRKSSAKVGSKKLQSSRNFGVPRAEKLPEIGQHALREPKSAAAALHRVRRASRCEKSARLASMSRNFCAKVARRNCKISGNPARRAHKNCVHSASEGCACSINVAEDVRVDSAFRSEKARVRRRDHANVAPKIARKK